jgi:predicted nucleic acid-binding protein
MLRGRESAVDDHAVLALAVRSGCSAYDCEFVWTAQNSNVPLVTGDRKVLAAFPHVAVSIQTFTS